jgi:tetratricopeptide (TPR) repeat protein
MEDQIKSIEIRFYRKGEGFTSNVGGDYPLPFTFPEPYWSFYKKDKVIAPELEAPFGNSLYDRIFNSDERKRKIAEALRLTTDQSLNLSIFSDEPTIHEIPWELINRDGSPNGFLLKSGNISITHTTGTISNVPPARPPFRILIILSLPLAIYKNAPLDPLYELEIIYKALEDCRDIVEIDVFEKASPSKIRERLIKSHYHIIHFTGHGLPGGLIFEKDEDYTEEAILKERELKELFSGLNVNAIILDACHTATATSLFDASTALRVHEGGIPLVIANQSSVRDILATKSMREIYKNLFTDLPFKVLNDVRLDLQREWWKPVVFIGAKPLEKLFEVQKIEKRNIPTCFKTLGLYRKGEPYVYRFEPVRKLTQALEISNYAVLHGIGGAGKSTIADYIVEFLKEKFNHVVAIDLKEEGIKRPEELIDRVAEEFSNFSVINDVLPILNEKGAIRKWQKFNEAVQTNHWLLILDNFEVFQDENGIIQDKDWVRFINELITNWRGKFLITTRLKVFLNERSSLENTIDIGTFSETEFLFLLMQIEEKEKGEREKAKGKIESLVRNKDTLKHFDYHPLFIRRFIDTHPEDMKSLLNDPQITSLMEFYRPYFEKWPSLKRLLLLNFPFSTILFEKMLANDLEAKDLLENRLLILKKENDIQKIYSLIRDYILGHIGLEDLPKKEVYEILKDVEPQHLWDSENKVEFLRLAIENGYDEKKKVEENLSEELNRLGVFYIEKDPNKAVDYILQSLKIRLDIFGEEHLDVAASYNNLGSAYHHKGDLDQAIRYHNKALKIWLDIFGEKHPHVATTYNNLGGVYHHKGDLDQAIDHYNKALRIQLDLFDLFGEKHPDVARSYNNLGVGYGDKGDFDQAIDYYHKALKIWLDLFGEKHPDVARSYNNLGSAWRDKGDFDQAIDYHNKALKIWLDLFGEKHPDVARSYNNLGSAWRDKGDFDQAIDYHNKALKIWLDIFGEKHPDVARSYNNLGSAWRDKGDFDQAIRYYNKAIKLQVNLLGEIHPDVATSYNNLGNAYSDKGDLDQGIDFYNKALKIGLDLLGEKHPDVARSYNNLGSAYYDKGDFNQAIHYYNKALKIVLDLLGEIHSYVARSYNNLGLACHAKRDLDQAMFYYAKSLNVYDRLFEESNDLIYYMEVSGKHLIIADLFREKRKRKEALINLCEGANRIAESLHFVNAGKLAPELHLRQVKNLFQTAKRLKVIENPPDECKESFKKLEGLFNRLKLLDSALEKKKKKEVDILV